MHSLITFLLVLSACNISHQSNDLSWDSIIGARPTTNPLASIKVEHAFTRRPTVAAVAGNTTRSTVTDTSSAEDDTRPTPTMPTATATKSAPATVATTATAATATDADTSTKSSGTIKLSDIFKNQPTQSVTPSRVTRPTVSIGSSSNGGDRSDILENNGYCCKKAMMMETEDRTRLVKITKIQQVQSIVGYKSCLTGYNLKSGDGARRRRFLWNGAGKDAHGQSESGNEDTPEKFFEARGCPIFRTEDIPVEEYSTETFKVPVNIMQCVGPITCCQSYVRLPNGQCQHEALISEHKDTLDVLGKLGLTG